MQEGVLIHEHRLPYMPCALPSGSCTVQGDQRDSGPVPKVRKFPIFFKPRENRLGQECGKRYVLFPGSVRGRDLQKTSPGIGIPSCASRVVLSRPTSRCYPPFPKSPEKARPDFPLRLSPPCCRRIRVSISPHGGRRDAVGDRTDPGRHPPVFPILKPPQSERAAIPIPMCRV